MATRILVKAVLALLLCTVTLFPTPATASSFFQKTKEPKNSIFDTIRQPEGEGSETTAQPEITMEPEPTAEAVVMQRVFDYADLLSGDEIDELEEAAMHASRVYGMQFILVTRPDNDGDIEVKDYANDYYVENFRDKGYPDGIQMTLDTANRKYWINTFGFARERMSDYQAGDIIDAVRDDMRADNFARVFSTFLDRSASIIDASIEEERRDAEYQQKLADLLENPPLPELEIGKHVYDMAGDVSAAQVELLENRVAAMEEELGVSLLLVSNAEQLYETIDAFNELIYQEYTALGGRADCAVLVLNNAESLVSSRNYGEAEQSFSNVYYIDEELRGQNTNTAFTIFVDAAEESIGHARMLERMVVPKVEAGRFFYDIDDSLPAEEQESIAAYIKEQARGRNFAAVLANLESPELLPEFSTRFGEQNEMPFYTTVCLYIDANSGEYTFSEGGFYSKMRYDEQIAMDEAVGEFMAKGEIAQACESYFSDMNKYASRILPDIRMLDSAPEYITFALVVGLVIGLVVVLIMWLMHRRTRAKAPGTYNYLEQMDLTYSHDTFLYSHTSQSRRAKSSDSDSGSSTSYGGGSDSGGAGGSY